MPEPVNNRNQWAGLPVVILETFRIFPISNFLFSAGSGLHSQAYELADTSQSSKVDKFECFIKFLSKYMRIFGYFGKIIFVVFNSALVLGR